MTTSRSISSFLFVLLLASPSLMHGASTKGVQMPNRLTITKPARGNYPMNSKEKGIKGYVPSSSQAKMKTFKLAVSPFIFKYPDSWKATGNSTSAMLSPEFDGQSLKTKRDSYIAIIADPISGKQSYSLQELNAYVRSHVEISSQQLLSDWYVPSYSFIGSGTTMFLGHPALVYEYTGEIGSVKNRFKRITTSFDNQIVTAYFFSKPETFEQDLPVFDGVLKTLTMTTKKAASSAASSRSSKARK